MAKRAVKKESPDSAPKTCRQKGFSVDTCSDRFLKRHRKIVLFIANKLYDEILSVPQPLCMHDFIIDALEEKFIPKRRKKVVYSIETFDKGINFNYGSVNSKLNGL